MDYLSKLSYNSICKVRGQRSFYILQVYKKLERNMIISHMTKQRKSWAIKAVQTHNIFIKNGEFASFEFSTVFKKYSLGPFLSCICHVLTSKGKEKRDPDMQYSLNFVNFSLLSSLATDILIHGSIYSCVCCNLMVHFSSMTSLNEFQYTIYHFKCTGAKGWKVLHILYNT